MKYLTRPPFNKRLKVFSSYQELVEQCLEVLSTRWSTKVTGYVRRCVTQYSSVSTETRHHQSFLRSHFPGLKLLFTLIIFISKAVRTPFPTSTHCLPCLCPFRLTKSVSQWTDKHMITILVP